jgi:ribosomal protein S18 acetylase RimI-like enzyme
MHIRAARLDDLPAVYRICHELGLPDTGEPRCPELLGHVYAGPYIVGPGTRSVVVVDDVGVAGYLLCALDTAAFERWRDESWWPALRADYPRVLDGRSAADQEIVDLLHTPTRPSAAVEERYPAHLHLDLLPRLQGRGVGGRLVGDLISELAARGIPGLHLDVGADNLGAIAFYRRLGFAEQERGTDSVFMAMEIAAAESGTTARRP